MMYTRKLLRDGEEGEGLVEKEAKISCRVPPLKKTIGVGIELWLEVAPLRILNDKMVVQQVKNPPANAICTTVS